MHTIIEHIKFQAFVCKATKHSQMNKSILLPHTTYYSEMQGVVVYKSSVIIKKKKVATTTTNAHNINDTTIYIVYVFGIAL